MEPINIEGSNKTYGKPTNWKDEQCKSIAVYEGEAKSMERINETLFFDSDIDKKNPVAKLDFIFKPIKNNWTYITVNGETWGCSIQKIEERIFNGFVKVHVFFTKTYKE